MRTSAIRFQPDDRNFEAIFEIPDSHRLVQVRSKSRGGIMRSDLSFEEAIALNERLRRPLEATKDYEEGIRAHFEKRPAVFRGE